MGTAQKSRYVTRQRDGIRTIGWCSIGLAPLVLAAPMVDLEAERDALLRLCQSGLGWACLRPDANGTAPWLAAPSWVSTPSAAICGSCSSPGAVRGSPA